MLLAARQCLHGNVLLTASLLSLLARAPRHWRFTDAWLDGRTDPADLCRIHLRTGDARGSIELHAGRLGSAEAVMVGLLMFKGMPGADAVAATVLIRLATLWFAVAIGAVMLSRFTGAKPVPNPQS